MLLFHITASPCYSWSMGELRETMKKIALLFLSLGVCIMLCACGASSAPAPSAPETQAPADYSPAVDATPAPTASPAPTPTPELPAPVISAREYTEPTEITEGNGFTLAGTVECAPGKLTSVTASIKNSSGGVEQTKTYSADDSIFSISDFDYDIYFGQLAPGNYYYTVSATAANGDKIVTSELINTPFTVIERPAISVDALFEGTYVYMFAFCNGQEIDPITAFGSMFYMGESMHSIYMSENQFSGYLGSCGLSGTYECNPYNGEEYINISSFYQYDENEEMNRMRIQDMHTESANIESGVFGIIITLYDPSSGNTYEVWFSHPY